MEVEQGYSIAEAQSKIGIGHSKLYQEIRRGALKTCKIGRRTVITGSAINAYWKLIQSEARA
jgi:hypothetical protein